MEDINLIGQLKVSWLIVKSVKDVWFYLFESSAEPLKHPFHVATLLHGNDTGVVFFIDPY